MTRRAFWIWTISLGQLLIVLLTMGGLHQGWFPAGLPSEWVWLRVSVGLNLPGLAAAAIVAVMYVGFCASVARRWNRAAPGARAEGLSLACLVVAAIMVQFAIQSGAPYGYGLTKWVTLAMPGASGYQEIAVGEAVDARKFWADYPTWIQDQDALHIGTHPPGPILVASGLNRWTKSHPAATRAILGWTPESVTRGFSEIVGPRPQAERAAIVLAGALTMLACALTVVPLYGLARKSFDASTAWATSCLWPILPSAILFQPTADTAYPLLSATAVALAAWGECGSWRANVRSFASGMVLALGMQFTLAFLAVGLIVFLLVTIDPLQRVEGRARRTPWSKRRVMVRLGLIGAGFLAATCVAWMVSSANPFAIWWWNQAHHARFYVEFPRSYLAWLLINPIELAIAIGLPTTLLILLGLGGNARPVAVSWITLGTMILLTVSGRNLSEVARLWLPLMPPLLVAAGAALNRIDTCGQLLGATLLTLALQSMMLQNTLQVVYPI